MSCPIMINENNMVAPVNSLGPRSIQDLHAAKENRASEALKMKDEQIRILSEQNNKLLSSLDRAEEELGTFQLEKLTIEEENRTLRVSNFELQLKAKSAEGQLDEIKSGFEDTESQLTIMSTKNAELLKLLEGEEANTSKIISEFESCKNDSESLSKKYTSLVESTKEAGETARSAMRENQLKSDEIRVLRLEVEQLKQRNSELTIQTTVELEAVQEQLRLRKGKQYQLLGKLQSQEEAGRQAEDHAKEMEQTVRELRQKISDLQIQLQLETNARISQDNSNRTLTIDFQAASAENKELSSKLQEMDQDRQKLEVEARDNGEQLREMAEKVFQLLERLKLAELGKKKSMEALTKKEQELFSMKKQHSKIKDDNANEKRSREKIESEKRVLEDQLRGLKKVNSQLGNKLKDEAKSRIREEEACKEANEKVRTLDGRLAFLLNRLQTDEEAKSAQHEEIKQMQTQIQNLSQRSEILQTKLTHAEESHRESKEKLQASDMHLKETKIKLEALEQTMKIEEESAIRHERKALQAKEKPEKHLAGGQLRFFVDSRPSLGQVAIKGKSPKDKVWIEEKGCNNFLRKVLKGQNGYEALVQRIAELYGAILFGEEQLEKADDDSKSRKEDIDRIYRELNKMQSYLCAEEESKRRVLLRYVRAVKASVSLGEPGCEKDREEVGSVGAGRIQLPESSLGDEEVHVVASMLRDNVTIEELQFRRNYISDDGARAIAAVLADRSALRLIDLRENHVSMIGIKAIADALERSKRVRHVFVHPGGKIEAFGSSETIDGSESTTLAVSTVCIVDVRDNIPKDDVQKAKAAEQLKFMQKRRQSENEMKGGKKTRQSMSQSPSQKHRHKKRNAFPPVRPLSAGSTKSKESKRFGDQQIVKRSQMSPFLKK